MSLICKICGFEGNSLLSHIRHKHNMTPDEYKVKYKIETLHVMNDEQKRNLSDLWKKRFSEKKWKDIYALNKKSHFTTKFWLGKGFTEEEAVQKISELQSSISKRRDYKNSPTHLSTKFWMDRDYTDKQAAEIIHDIQSELSSRSKKFKGKKHSTESKMKVSNSMKDYINSHGKIKWANHFGDLSTPQYRSNGEIELFLFVKNELGYNAVANDFVLDKYNVDIIVDKKIIEYFGDYWHGSELLFENDEVHKHIGLSASEIRKRDDQKIKEMENAGYKVLIIWESEYISNSDEVKMKIKNFLA